MFLYFLVSPSQSYFLWNIINGNIASPYLHNFIHENDVFLYNFVKVYDFEFTKSFCDMPYVDFSNNIRGLKGIFADSGIETLYSK